MRKFLCFTVMFAVVLVMCSPVIAAQSDGKYIVLDVEGEGRDRNSAIESAWLSGIRQAVGSFIDAKTELNNDQLTERIIAYSRGLVDKYEVTGVDDSRASVGIYKVKMRLWIIQELLRDGAKHASTGSASIAFSAEDVIRQQKEELDAKALEARNAAAETAKMKAKTGAELLSAMLGRYKPEDFLTCYIPGKPEAVKDKADFFKLNVQINFNDKLYKESFIPDLIQVLDQIASVKKNTMLVKYKQDLRNIASKKGSTRQASSVIFNADGLGTNGYTLAVYNRPERFGVRMYGFKSDDANSINSALLRFMRCTSRVQGIVLELQDEDKETIETIERKLDLKFLMTNKPDNKKLWAVHPTIMQKTGSATSSYQENSQVIVPVEIEMPSEVLPYVKEIKASLLLREEIEDAPAWLGLGFKGNTTTIARFDSNSPAMRSPLRTGDTITSVDGFKVYTASDITKIINEMNAGDTVTIQTQRGKYDIVLGKKP